MSLLARQWWPGRRAFNFHLANDLMNLLVRAETSTRLDDIQYLENEALARSEGAGIERFVYQNAQGNAMPHRHRLNMHEERLASALPGGAFSKASIFPCAPLPPTPPRPFARPARLNSAPYRSTASNNRCSSSTSGIPSLAYLPANAAPIGRTAMGLPCGVQVTGPAYGDHDVATASGLFSDLKVQMDRCGEAGIALVL